MCSEGGLAVRGVLCVGIAVGILFLSAAGFAQDPPPPPPGDPPPEQVCPCWDIGSETWALDQFQAEPAGHAEWVSENRYVWCRAHARAGGGAGTVSGEAFVLGHALVPVGKTQAPCPDVTIMAEAYGHIDSEMTLRVIGMQDGIARGMWKAQSHLMTSPGPGDYWERRFPSGNPPPEAQEQLGIGEQIWYPLEQGWSLVATPKPVVFSEDGNVKVYLFVNAYATAFGPWGQAGEAYADSRVGNTLTNFWVTQ